MPLVEGFEIWDNKQINCIYFWDPTVYLAQVDVFLVKRAPIIVVIVGIIVYYFYSNMQKEEEIIEIEEENTIQENKQIDKVEEEQIIVHIAGEVKKEGIIKTKEGARIADIIEQAGGLNEEADITDINLAYPVEDGQKIIIPKRGQEPNEYKIEESTNNSENNIKTTNKKIPRVNLSVTREMFTSC